jgi:hypothetical protein
MLLELILGLLLGICSGELLVALDTRVRRWAIWPIWIIVIYGGTLAYKSVAPGVTTTTLLKAVLGGALFGAFLATLCAWTVGRIVMRVLGRT